MVAPPASRLEGSFPYASLDDPAFDPNPGFDFDDTSDELLRSIHDDIASLNVFNHGGHSGFSTVVRQRGQNLPSFDPFPVGTGAFAPGMAPSMNPTNVFAGASKFAGAVTNMSGPTLLPPTIQSNIVQGRSTSVAEMFGQVTPPDRTPPEIGDRKSSTASSQSATSQSGKATKLDKSERARHAANQRHAKSKLARQAREVCEEPKSSDGSEDGEGDVQDKREKYREKNRMAAAKCRKKKKTNVNQLEEQHRSLSASNNFLRREERSLRDELSMLRTAALQHTPASHDCCCADIYEYNRRKASQVAYGLGGPMVSSPSDGVLSPGTHGGMGRTNSMSGGPLPQMFAEPQSFSSGSNMAFAPVTTPPSIMLTTTTTAHDGQHGFPGFLQDSLGPLGGHDL